MNEEVELPSDEIKPFSSEELFHIRWSALSFRYFLKVIFPESFKDEQFYMADGEFHAFELSEIHYLWADIAQLHPRLGILAPRMHLKSTVLNSAFAMWVGFRAWIRGWSYCDGMVFSFNEDLARAHNARTKRYIKANKYFRFWIDKTPRAESGINFVCSFGPETPKWVFQMDAKGIFGAARGRHPKFVICDDILSDFTNPLDPPQIKRINTIMSSVIMSLPQPRDHLVVVGTPQSYEDALYKLKHNKVFFWARCPAELEDGRTLWPEQFNLKALRAMRTQVGRDAYQVEYLLSPFLVVNSRLPREIVEECIEKGWKGLSLDDVFENPSNYPVFGGMDVGQRIHPSHITVGMVIDGDLIQVYQEFLEHMDYRVQAKLVNRIVRHFKIDRFIYDDTRAELSDRGLSKKVRGFKFTKKSKGNAALLFEKRVYAEDDDDPGIVLIDNAHQLTQILAVDRTLKSLETEGGHGDSFWSIALMCVAAEQGLTLTFGDASRTFVPGRRRITPENMIPA